MKTKIEKHFDEIAPTYDLGKRKYTYYYWNLRKLLHELIPSDKKVLEVGCGTGDLIASLNPDKGIGVDISGEMVKLAESKYKLYRNLQFSKTWPKGEFEYIFMSDVIEHLENPIATFKKVVNLMGRKSKFIITMENPIWEPLLMIWERLGWKMKEGPHKRIDGEELRIILKESGMKIIKHDYRLLVPIKIPVLTYIANKYLEGCLKKYAFIEYVVSSKN
jgi:SAM-dependent methyltransferase